MSVQGFTATLDTLVRARYPFVYLVSWEEKRVDTILAELARHHGKQLVEFIEQTARDEAKPDLATQTLDPIVRTANTNRWLLLGGGTVVIAFGAVMIGPIVWGLLPVLLAVVIGSAFSRT